MAQGKITAKQKEILEYIKEQILERGYPPAVREICEAVHLKSPLPSTLIWRPWRRTDTSEGIPRSRGRSKSATTVFKWFGQKW